MSGNILVCMQEVEAKQTTLDWLEEEGYTVTVVSELDETIKRLATSEPSVLLVELSVDPSHGLDKIRDLRAATGVPIMIIGENENDERPLLALDLGADDYICRTPDAEVPLARKELLSRLAVALRRSTDMSKDVGEIVAGGIRIRLDNYEISVDGEEITLTPNEFRLLACLAAEPERVFTHVELLSRIWGPHATDRVNYLHVYIDRLRKRIEQEPSQPRRLLSVRGVGYRLALPED